MISRRHVGHGNRCSCRLLAEAIGFNPRTIGFTYCRAVLMNHWVVECNHGCHDEAVESGRSGKWHDVGPIDPIKAILITND